MIPEGGAEVEGAKPVHTLAAIALKQVKLTCPTIRYADSNMQEWSVGAPQSDGRILKIARTPQPDSRRPAGLRIGEAGQRLHRFHHVAKCDRAWCQGRRTALRPVVSVGDTAGRSGRWSEIRLRSTVACGTPPTRPVAPSYRLLARRSRRAPVARRVGECEQRSVRRCQAARRLARRRSHRTKRDSLSALTFSYSSGTDRVGWRKKSTQSTAPPRA
jgi:hypothetical protein